ncbi:MAG: UDP-N-acetylmuramoylalanine--D-glutamate ligase, partial [Ilumatobacter sp.]
MRALVYGLAVTGESTARALQRHGYEVVVGDDVVTNQRRSVADELGVELLEAPQGDVLSALIATCELVSPAPGVPETHRVVTTARSLGVEVVSEIELAYRWERE